MTVRGKQLIQSLTQTEAAAVGEFNREQNEDLSLRVWQKMTNYNINSLKAALHFSLYLLKQHSLSLFTLSLCRSTTVASSLSFIH